MYFSNENFIFLRIKKSLTLFLKKKKEKIVMKNNEICKKNIRNFHRLPIHRLIGLKLVLSMFKNSCKKI